MGFREVSVVGVREILRLWLLGYGPAHGGAPRPSGSQDRVLRRRCRRGGRARAGDSEDKLIDELIGEVFDAVRPGRPPGDHGSSWELLRKHKGFIEERVKKKLTLVKVYG